MMKVGKVSHPAGDDLAAADEQDDAHGESGQHRHHRGHGGIGLHEAELSTIQLLIHVLEAPGREVFHPVGLDDRDAGDGLLHLVRSLREALLDEQAPVMDRTAERTGDDDEERVRQQHEERELHVFRQHRANHRGVEDGRLHHVEQAHAHQEPHRIDVVHAAAHDVAGARAAPH
jgi:hypothetical protein